MQEFIRRVWKANSIGFPFNWCSPNGQRNRRLAKYARRARLLGLVVRVQPSGGLQGGYCLTPAGEAFARSIGLE